VAESRRLDLRGVPCPLSWAKAKVYLESLPRGARLELLLDDAKGARDIPRAAEAEGYVVEWMESEQLLWRLLIHC
jgi:tRNA 2-thiouridine synthesizing protein A